MSGAQEKASRTKTPSLSAEDLGETDDNASLVIPSECKDHVNDGGRKERRKEPSDFPTMKDERRQDEGRGRTDEPSLHPGRRTFDVTKLRNLRHIYAEGSAAERRIQAFNELELLRVRRHIVQRVAGECSAHFPNC